MLDWSLHIKGSWWQLQISNMIWGNSRNFPIVWELCSSKVWLLSVSNRKIRLQSFSHQGIHTVDGWTSPVEASYLLELFVLFWFIQRFGTAKPTPTIPWKQQTLAPFNGFWGSVTCHWILRPEITDFGGAGFDLEVEQVRGGGECYAWSIAGVSKWFTIKIQTASWSLEGWAVRMKTFQADLVLEHYLLEMFSLLVRIAE